MNTEFEKQLEELKKKVSKLEKGQKDKMTMVVFSGELDKLMAAMIIATGATAMDMEVKLFFYLLGHCGTSRPKEECERKNIYVQDVWIYAA